MLSQVININETIKDLERRGLKITDYKLLRYYIANFNINTFLVEYKDFFLDDNGRFDNATSDDLINLYRFDRDFGNHLLREILVLEKIINTNVVYATINYFHLKDRCLLKLDKNRLKEEVLPNYIYIDPPLSFEQLLVKMIRYLDAKKNTRLLIDHNCKDQIFKWKNVPLDIMCLSWSFATTFSFFISLNTNIKDLVLQNLNINSKNVIGFCDLIKNVINIRNLISHNMAIYEEDIKYQSDNLKSFYYDLTGEKIDGDFRLPHIIVCIAKLSGYSELYNKTIKQINLLNITDKHKQKILELFSL